MVNNSALSDVVFVCSDGQRVHSSRILLAGRSEVMKNMLDNGMSETRLFEIELHQISSLALLSVLEFLYTGALLDYHPQSWSAAYELILASRFFLLPKLEIITRKFMHKKIFDVAGDRAKAASLLTEAIGFNGLCDKDDVFLTELVTILSSSFTKFDRKFVRSLSEDAFHYLLGNSKSNSEHGWRVSMREYWRFACVLVWWVPRANLGSRAIKVLRKLFSECHDSRAEREESPLQDTPSPLNGWNFNQLDDTSKNCVTRLLSNIDCRRIHPTWLETVVEPLEMISPAEILDASEFHELRSPRFPSSQTEYVWDHGESCQSLYNGHVIKREASKIGLAVMKGVMLSKIGLAVMKAVIVHSDSVYEWTFTVEETCDDFIELGFIYLSSILGTKRPKLDGERISDQENAGALKIEGCQWSVNSDGPVGRADWKTLANPLSMMASRVLFTYRDSEHTCSLSINEHDFGVVWKNLPSRLFYPAICFGESSKGQVHFAPLTGIPLKV